MTEKRFDYEYVDDKFYNKGFFLDNGKEMFKDEVLNTLNELHEENHSLKLKHMEMLDFIEEKGTVTVNDIKQWWNTTR